MADTTGTCAGCGGPFPIRLLRFRKIGDAYKYLCTECRKALKEAK